MTIEELKTLVRERETDSRRLHLGLGSYNVEILLLILDKLAELEAKQNAGIPHSGAYTVAG